MIYCVEDDDDIRELMLYTLRTAGFEAQGFPDSVLFWKAMEEEQPKLILLDIMLPVDDGLTILKSLRSNGMTKDIPVIMTTAKGTEFDKVKGLDLGADDFSHQSSSQTYIQSGTGNSFDNKKPLSGCKELHG